MIAIESTPWLSAHNTSRILYPLFHFLFGIELFRFEIVNFYLRKCGHVVGYGILSWLAFRAWRETFPAQGDPRWTMRWSTIAVLMTALVASLDEWHQSFIPTRTGRWQDVVLDTCAGIAMQVILFAWLTRRPNFSSSSRQLR